MADLRVALVYDRVNKWGGAERVLLALHELFPKAPLYTSVYSPKRAGWAERFVVKTSFLQHIPYASVSHESFALFMPVAFEQFSFAEYDLVISLTSEAAKGIISKPKTKHICYCLTPTRYLWSGYDEYFPNAMMRFLSKPAVSYLRSWDKMASTRPDKIIAISKEVQNRVKKYYGRESEVIYPPVDLSIKYQVSRQRRGSLASLRSGPEAASMKHKGEGYFLVVSRLVPYKRIDIAIEACNRLKLPLKIVGIGADKGRLRSMAGPTVQFVGNLTDRELVTYYKNCKALLFPGREDFGITIIEAAGFGKPVIAFGEGGAKETIVEGKTGSFFYSQTPEALMRKIRRFDALKINPDDCMRQAEKFSIEHFKARFLSIIQEVMSVDLTQLRS